MASKFGNVRQLASGKFQARYTGPDGATHKAPTTYHLRGDAHTWLEKEQRAIHLNVWQPPAQLLAEKSAEVARDRFTVRVWLTEWLGHKERENLKPSTIASYRDRITRRITGEKLPQMIREFADLPVSEVTPARARLWWSAVESYWPDSGEMNSKAYQHLRSAFAYLVEDEVIPTNPISVKAARRRPKPVLSKDLLDVEELTALYRESPVRYRLITALTLFHGLRVGEALGLQRRHVIVEEVPPRGGGAGVEGPADLRVGVRVEDNLQRIDGVMVPMGSPKTGAGVRIVPVFRTFHADIIAHLAEFTGPDDQDLVTPARRGGNHKGGRPVMDTTYRTVLAGMRSRAGVVKRVHPHAGRRFITTALLEQGVEPQVVGEIIGDKDLTTVLEVYAQVRAGRTEEVMGQLGRGISL